MNLIRGLLDRPRVVASLTLLGAVVGFLAFEEMPLNLFPDLNRPTVNVVTQWPGAAADDVAREVTHPLEVRLSGLDGVRRVSSTSRDQVSGVSVEFEYGTGLGSAATDVANEIPRVRSLLPAGVRDPIIFKISDAARPVLVLSVTAKPDSGLDLNDVRRLAENPGRDALLVIPGVAEAEVFGAAERRVEVALDRDLLENHGLTVEAVAAALAASNVSIPAGLVRREGTRVLLTTRALASTPEELAATLVPLTDGGYLRVGDLGSVGWGTNDPSSLYLGNGRPSVAISLLRSENGHASEALASIDRALPALRRDFPFLEFEVAETQQRLIHLTVSNMLSALRDAVLMTLGVILLFIGNTRAALVTAISLPVTYLITFAGMNLIGFEFDMVTLTAVIIAVGLLADDVVVVIENVERRMRTLGESGLEAAARGTKEILLADAAGTVSTVVVLIPVIFIGGFVQTVLRPLCVTLSIALFASLLVSVTLIPLLASRFVRPGAWDPLAWPLRAFDRFLLEPFKAAYVAIVGWGLRNRLLVVIVFGAMTVFSAKLMPLLGRELMPLMDTGVLSIRYEAEPDTDDTEMSRLAQQVERSIRAEIPPAWLLTTSHVVGSEPGVKSFGAARTLQQGSVTVNIINRFDRNRTMQEIAEGLRRRMRRIPGLISVNMFEFGATPLSSLRGTVDLMVSGPDPAVLDFVADDIEERLSGVRGLTGVERSWRGGASRLNLAVDPERARLYGVAPGDVAARVSSAVRGMPGGLLRVAGENSIPVWVRLRHDQRSDEEQLAALVMPTPRGSLLPLAAMARFEHRRVPTSETHQGLSPTVDILGFRRNIAVTHLQDRVDIALEGLSLPRGYSLSREGEIKQMNESFRRLGTSIGIGLVLLYLMLVVTFRSFRDPIAIMGTLPMALIGANWAMLIFGKHGCLPSFMGLILLMGIVVNNGILLIDFAKVGIREGKELRDALLDAVRLRTRPILMTAGASAVGMVPIAFEWAFGVERLSPLAVVAIGGLVAGTFLTLLVVPVLFSLLHGLSARRGQAPTA